MNVALPRITYSAMGPRPISAQEQLGIIRPISGSSDQCDGPGRASFPSRPPLDHYFGVNAPSPAAYHRSLLSQLRQNPEARRVFHVTVSAKKRVLPRLQDPQPTISRPSPRGDHASRGAKALDAIAKESRAMNQVANDAYNRSLVEAPQRDPASLAALRYAALGPQRERMLRQWVMVVHAVPLAMHAAHTMQTIMRDARHREAIQSALRTLRIHLLPRVQAYVRAKRASALAVISRFVVRHVRKWLRTVAVERLKVALFQYAKAYRHVAALRLFHVRVRTAQRACRRWVMRRRLQIGALDAQWSAAERAMVETERAAELQMLRVKLRHVEPLAMLALKPDNAARVRWAAGVTDRVPTDKEAKALAATALRVSDSPSLWRQLVVAGAADAPPRQLRGMVDAVGAHVFLPDEETSSADRADVLRMLLRERLAEYARRRAAYPQQRDAWERRRLILSPGAGETRVYDGGTETATTIIGGDRFVRAAAARIARRASLLDVGTSGAPPDPPRWRLLLPERQLKDEIRRLRWLVIAQRYSPNPYALSQLYAAHHSAHPKSIDDYDPSIIATFQFEAMRPHGGALSSPTSASATSPQSPMASRDANLANAGSEGLF